MRTITAWWQLFRLAISTRFNLRGAYWAWRRETAFGGDESKWPDASHRREVMLEYGRWIHTMRRLR